MAADEEKAKQYFTRFSDILNEPRPKPSPIKGYEKMPLVSLEEAVQPLRSILPEVELYTCMTKQGSINPADYLTQDESASIILHSMVWEPHEECLYFALNTSLRSEDRQKLKPWFLYLKLILTALSKLPSIRQTVYHGVKENLSALYPTGREFVWWGFSSCTSTLSELDDDQFLGRTGPRTIFVIECDDTVKDISRHSYYKSQANIRLLLPAQQFQVVTCMKTSPDLTIIQLKQTIPPYPLLPQVHLSPYSNDGPCASAAQPTLGVPAHAGMGVRFVDVSNTAGLKRVMWSKQAPDWRRATRGMCFEGTCTTTNCEAYSKQVIIGIGLRKFDLVLDSNASTCQCPMCHEYVEPIKCSFNNCDWRWSGVKQLPGKPPEKCSSGDGWSYADDAYYYFDESVSGEVVWRQLLLEAKKHE